jgi:type I restriction enzyme S subunit
VTPVVSKLGALTKIRTGKLDANASSEDGEYPFFTCAKQPLRISSYSYDCECVLVAGNGDLNVKYFEGKFDAYQRTYILETLPEKKSELHLRYVYYFMEKYLEKLREQSIGGIIKYIKLGNLTDAKIPLPPLEEQKRIAGILDAADILRAKRREALSKLDDLLQSTFLDLFGDPVTNPKGWEVAKLGDLGTLDRGVSKHRPRNEPALLGGKHPLIQTGEVANSKGYIRTYTSTYSDLGLKQSKMWPAGTLCITIAANIASTGILTFSACFPDSVVGFQSEEQGRIEYVQGLFWSLKKIIEARAPQVAQKNINLKILRELPVPQPPQDLQHRFAAIVEQVETQKARMRTQLTELDTLFAALQQRAFNGEL